MTAAYPCDVRVLTQRPGAVLLVGSREGSVVVAVEESAAGAGQSVTLSPEQAEMVLHALGLAVAGIREEARLKAQERAGLAERLLDQEVRLRGH